MDTGESGRVGFGAPDGVAGECLSPGFEEKPLSDEGADEKNQDVQTGGRLVSLDALRGFDMFWIIGGGRIVGDLVKGTGNVFLHDNLLPQLKHVPWEGYHYLEDTIMPLFLFIVGVAMPFSFAKRLKRGDRKRKLCFHVFVRFVILFVLGMVAAGNLLKFDISKLHLYNNTLQAIASGYLIAAIVMLTLRPAWQWAVAAVLLLLYWGLMMLVPVPGHGAGVLTEDGNLAVYLDHLILGRFHDGSSYTWILSSLVFAVTVLMGVFAGQLLRSKRNGHLKALLLVVSGVTCIGLGLLWGEVFPIIKHLWTSSFVLFSGGLSLLLLAAFYLVIDVWGLKKWAFVFVVIGMNAIAIYMATHLFNFREIGDIFVGGLGKWLGGWNGFVQSMAAFVVIWVIMFWMYRKKSFIKV